MKISKWSDLNGIESDEYRLFVSKDYVQIRKFMLLTSGIYLYFNFMSDDMILAILKLFGFDVEFKKPQKLSKREYHLVNYLDESYWIARHADMGIYVYKAEPKKGSNGFWTPVFWQEMLLDGRLFPFITPDRAWSVKELRELEVEDEN